MSGEYTVENRQAQTVKGTDGMVGMFMRELYDKEPLWLNQLTQTPLTHESIEDEVNALFKRGAAYFMIGLGAKVMQSREHQDRCEVVRENYASELRAGKDRQIEVYQVNGITCFAKTSYCTPIRNAGCDSKIPGIDIELAQFGFSCGVSPSLQSKVSRTYALSHSMKIAQQELARDAVELDPKTIDRIAFQCGNEFLTVRERQLAAFRDGTLECTNAMQGKRISVQIDGGRTRTRIERPVLTEAEMLKQYSESLGSQGDAGELTKDTNSDGGRSKRKINRRTFEAVWREPKMISIYVHDSDGKLDDSVSAVIDGSFADADYTKELVAMHLKRLGADRAASITFNSDGAKWIWDRIDSILTLAGIPSSVSVFRVLDFYHAAEHISDALSLLGLDEKERSVPFSDYRTKLRDNNWRSVVEGLKERYGKLPQSNQIRIAKEFERELRYFESHGAQGHLEYAQFKLLGLPLGSGSIESVVRRVVNLRMKGNSMYWKIEKAEAMLALRASILSERWDEHRLAAKHAMLRNSKLEMPALVNKPTKTFVEPDVKEKVSNSL